MPTCCVYTSGNKSCVQCVSSTRCPNLENLGWTFSNSFNVPHCDDCRGLSCFEATPCARKRNDLLDCPNGPHDDKEFESDLLRLE